MTYRTVDSQRLAFLFSAGLEPQEVKKLLKEARTRLITAGAKMHKLSDNWEGRVRFLAQLDAKAAEVVADWMRANVHVKDALLPEALVAQFTALERSTGRKTNEQTAQHARAGIEYLYRDDPPDVWMEFLRSPITGSKKSRPKVKSEGGAGKSDDAKQDDIVAVQPPALSQEAVVELAEVFQGGGGIGAKPFETVPGVVAKLLQRLCLSPTADVSEIVSPQELKILGADAIEAIQEQAKKWQSNAVKMGLLVRHPRALLEASSIDGDGAEIVGLCTQQTSVGSAVFVEPQAIIVNSEIWSLDHKAVEQIFEGSSRVIGFPNTRGLKIPEVGEMGIWRIERYPTQQAIKFRLQKASRSFFSIVDVPFPSADPDQVRAGMQHARVPHGGRPLFHLQDGLVVKTKNDVPELLTYAFDEPLDAWQYLEGWSVGQRTIAFSPLPAADRKLDCSELNTVLKRLLSDGDALKQLPSLSNAQVRAFLEAAELSGLGLTRGRLDRIRLELEAFVQDRERLDVLLGTVLGNATIRAEIEAAKKKILSDFEKSKTELASKRGNLEKEIRRLEVRQLKLQEQESETASKMSQAVRKAFEKAKESGAETLAQAAVFDAIRWTPRSDGLDGRRTDSISFSLETPSSDDGVKRLRLVGFRAADAELVDALSIAAVSHGLSVGILGPGANVVASIIAVSVARTKCAVIDIGVGLLSGHGFSEALVSAEKEADTVVVRGANCSDFSAYGTSLEMRLVDRLVKPQSSPKVLFGFADGPSALPVPPVLKDLCFLIDLSALSKSGDVEGDCVDRLLESAEDVPERPLRRLKRRALMAAVRDVRSGNPGGALLAKILEANLGDY